MVSVLLFSSQAEAAPEDCKSGITARLYAAFIVNDLTGRYEELRARDVLDHARDPREGCLIWLKIDQQILLAKVEPDKLKGARVCRTRTRIEAPDASNRALPELNELLALGGESFGAELLKLADFPTCSLVFVLREEGSVGVIAPPTSIRGPSIWAHSDLWTRVRLSSDLPSDGVSLSRLMTAVLSHPDLEPQSIGSLGVVFQGNGGFLGVFLAPTEEALFAVTICLPQLEVLGMTDLADEEISQFIGFEPDNEDAFLLAVVSSPNGTFDIRSVAAQCGN